MSEHLPAPEEEPYKLYGKSVDEWHAQLTGDNLNVPASRYGRDASEVSWWAIAAVSIHAVYLKEADEIEGFAEHAMSLAVNDDATLGQFVEANKHWLPGRIQNQLKIEGGDV